MKNKTAGSFTLLVTFIAFTGALLLAAGPVLSAGPVGTKTKFILAAFSPVQPKPSKVADNGVKPNWAWTSTVNVYGYTQINSRTFNFTHHVDRVMIASDTKGFSWSATWDRPWFAGAANRVKWSIPNVPVNKSYRITAYANDGSRKWTLVYVSKPLFFASDYHVPTDFVFDY